MKLLMQCLLDMKSYEEYPWSYTELH